MKIKIIISIITSLLVGLHTMSQECDTPFDISSWKVKGAPNGIWEEQSTNHVIGSIDATASSFFVSNQNLINVRIKGTVSVETSNDLDFIGIVFGYHKPTTLAFDNDYNFYLFDWKGENENGAYEGFRLSHYNGFITLEGQKSYMYGNVYNSPIRSKLGEKYNDTLGWVAFTDYEVELYYTSNLITIKINNELIFEKQGSFESGRFGYYCMSQRKVHFKDFSYESFLDFTPAPNSACMGDEISVSLSNPSGSGLPPFVQEVHWDFGDGYTSQEIIPVHAYENPGNYDVELIVWKDGDCRDTIVKSVTIHPDPIIDLGEDMDLAACSSVVLEAANPGANYFWSTGQTSQNIELINIPKDTIVWVEVEKYGCTDSDTVLIKVEEIQYQLFFPNAFTPNSDGNNDMFSPVGNTTNVASYHLSIYNRWGQKVFESTEPNNGWDGTYNGRLSTIGTYVYKVSYRMENCIGNQEYSNLTTLTLIN